MMQQEIQLLHTISEAQYATPPLSLPEIKIDVNKEQFILSKDNLYLTEEPKQQQVQTIEINNTGVNVGKYQCCNVV